MKRPNYVGIRERVTRTALAAYDEAAGRGYPHSFALQHAVDATVHAVLDELTPINTQRFSLDSPPSPDYAGQVTPVWQELKEIAVAVERLPEFIWRPDLNAEIIGTLDLLAKKLHELADEVRTP